MDKREEKLYNDENTFEIMLYLHYIHNAARLAQFCHRRNKLQFGETILKPFADLAKH